VTACGRKCNESKINWPQSEARPIFEFHGGNYMNDENQEVYYPPKPNLCK